MAYTIKTVDDFYLVESDDDKTNRLVIEPRENEVYFAVEFKNEHDEYIYQNKELEKVIEQGTYNMLLEKIEPTFLVSTKDLPSMLIEIAYLIQGEAKHGKSI